MHTGAWHFSSNACTAHELLSLKFLHNLLHCTFTNCEGRATPHALPSIAQWGDRQTVTRANLDHVAIRIVEEDLLDFHHVLDHRALHVVDPVPGQA